MRAHPIKSSFNAGELSPLLDGRIDVAKYGSGCKYIQNFITTTEGAAVRRGGTRFVNDIKSRLQRTWLSKFKFSNSQSFVLEFGNQYIRFYRNRGRLLTGAVSAWNNATAYTVGDLVTSGLNTYYCIANNTNQLPTNINFWYQLTDTIYEIPTPYTVSDLTNADGTFALRMAQTGDVIYITHPSYAPRKLQRFGNTRWVLSEVNLVGGPFNDQNTNRGVTVYASAQSGSVTLTASSAIFEASHVGGLFYLEVADFASLTPWESGKEIANGASSPLNVLRRSDSKTYKCTESGSPGTGNIWRTGSVKPTHVFGVVADGDGNAVSGFTPNITKQGVKWQFEDTGYGYLKITAFSSATSVTAQVVGDWNLPANVVGAGNASWRWAFGAFSNKFGFPTDVTFFRERLTFVKGQNLYLSVAGDFENFQDRYYGIQTPDSAIVVSAQSDQENTITWVSPGKRLIIGTSSAEFVCGENTTTDPLGPGNIKVEVQGTIGSASLKPVRIKDSTIFLTRSRRKLFDMKMNDLENYVTSDLTVLAEHITGAGIVDMDYQQEPYSTLWAVRSDGLLLSFTYNREQEVLGWQRHPIGGNGIVEAVTVIPSPDGTRDDVWLIVQRTINGQIRRFVEWITPEYQAGEDKQDKLYMDAGASYVGVSVSSIGGLDYLEGQTVNVLTNGAAHPDRVVTGGQINLQQPSTVVKVGLPCPAIVQTNRIEAGAQLGTAQGKIKRIHRVIINFLNTLGGRAGPSPDLTDEIVFRRGSDLMDSAPPLQTGSFTIEWPNGYDTDGFVTIRQDQPFPMTIVSVMPELVTYERT